MPRVIGLPHHITACLFDLDGVLTSTVEVHRDAWKETFDELLRSRDGAGFLPFTVADYNTYVDGRPRYDGVRTFFASRGIDLPEGTPDDAPTELTVHGVGNKKNALINKIITERGVTPYAGSVRYLEAVRDAGLDVAVVTSSANGAAVLDGAALTGFVRVRVDGVVIAERQLAGKPAPDSYLEAAAELGVPPEHAAVFEDALAGVRAGSDGGFGYVVGVDRIGQTDQLRAHGADVVVTDLDQLLEGN